ncbi:MAG: lysophospholipid acyltransferase family protein [Thermoleophilaceae bacterium]|jgi:1-acyl-sn-glycerol-3-phosphate acyltransferase
MQTLAASLVLPLLLLVVRVRVRGREHVPDGGYIVAANHPSVFDSLLVALPLHRRLRFMGKSELFTVRWGGWLARLGAFPVRRGVWDTDAFDTAVAVLDRGRVLAIFPEGGVQLEQSPARPGLGHIAHRAGAMVLPLHLSGTDKLSRPWLWPKVRVTVGEPFRVEHDADPSRERCQSTAQRAVDAIYALAG